MMHLTLTRIVTTEYFLLGRLCQLLGENKCMCRVPNTRKLNGQGQGKLWESHASYMIQMTFTVCFSATATTMHGSTITTVSLKWLQGYNLGPGKWGQAEDYVVVPLNTTTCM
jgi:hypothetical protein